MTELERIKRRLEGRTLDEVIVILYGAWNDERDAKEKAERELEAARTELSDLKRTLILMYKGGMELPASLAREVYAWECEQEGKR